MNLKIDLNSYFYHDYDNYYDCRRCGMNSWQQPTTHCVGHQLTFDEANQFIVNGEIVGDFILGKWINKKKLYEAISKLEKGDSFINIDSNLLAPEFYFDKEFFILENEPDQLTNDINFLGTDSSSMNCVRFNLSEASRRILPLSFAQEIYKEECQHEYVNVSFSFIEMQCKYCGKPQ